ncbi:MAG TPA: cytochrome c [Planctomycetota bacterium]
MIQCRNRRAAALAAALSFPVLACEFNPGAAELSYSLNRPVIEQNQDLARDAGAQAQLAGALEMLFGTAASPRFLAEPEWIEGGFDPNYWGEDLVKNDDALRASLEASNRATFAAQIAAIEAGTFDAVARPRHADDLWGWWEELKAEKSGDAAGLKSEGIALFAEYYPSLRASAALYRNQCYHCHGAEGGGDGSTSAFLEPRPRDYRPGKFKFTALKGKARPRHEDLFRILAEGIYTTAMPSFRRFSDAQLHGLVDYVRLLAIRGETEILLASFYEPDEGLNFANVQENYLDVVSKWRAAPEQLIAFEGPVPESTPERIAHGRALFTTPGDKGGANCVSCHGEGGRGDGPSVNDPKQSTDDWGRPIAPRDLTRGVYRFGRRPIDLFRRIYAGINGTPMPEHIGMTITENGQQRTMTEDDIWDLVFFVRSLATHAPAVAQHGGGHGGDLGGGH